MVKKYAICLGIQYNFLSKITDDSVKVLALGKPTFESMEQAEAHLAAYLTKNPKEIASIIPLYTAK